MGFELQYTPTREDAHEFPVYYDGRRRVFPGSDGEPPVREDGTPFDCITFWLVAVTGRVARQIADQMVEMDQRRGKAQMLSGSAQMTRVINGVLDIEGLERRGAPVRKLIAETYDLLPAWMTAALSEEIAKISGESTTSEEEREYIEG